MTAKKIRILVVDDAVVVRRLVTEALGSDPEIEVVGTAANGLIALQKIPQVNPDLVTLDVEMPELDGIGTLREIRKTWRKLPVIMFSTLTERGAATTLEALALGASDYVTKPANVGSVGAAQQRVRDDLIPKVKALCGRAPAAAPAGVAPRAALRPRPPALAGSPRRIDVVTIGVSTGGPNALAEVLPQLPEDFPAPILITQHMPPLFTKFLADRLTTKSRLRFVEAAAGMRLEPGFGYLAPGDFHLIVRRDDGGFSLDVHQGPPENSCRPAVDVMFRSVAAAFGPHVLSVILTGMGQDGLRGCEDIKAVGGQVIVQDERTSVVWGMPGFVANAGLADAVLPLDRIAGEILSRASVGRPLVSGSAGSLK